MTKVNILVVDDRSEGLLAVQAVLDSSLYNIVTASSGNEALKHLLKDDFAVILLDVQMPNMNGFEAASIIKTREKSKDIPIIFMSAINQDEQYVYQGYKVGAVDYLLKPFDPYILRSKVAIFVDIFLKKNLIKQQTEMIYESEIKTHSAALANLENKNLKRYQHLADSIPQIVFRLTANGDYEYFNKVWFEYTGLSEQNILGMKWRDVIHLEDLNKLMKLFVEVDRHESIEEECRIINKNGEFRWHLVRIQAERDSITGELFSWLGTATDIEDRKKMEETQRFLAEAGEALVSSLDYNFILQSISKISVPYLADWCSFDFVNEKNEFENLLTYHRDSNQIERVKQIHGLYLTHPHRNRGTENALETGKIQIVKNAGNSIFKFNDLRQDEFELARELNETTFMIIPLIAHGHSLGVLTFASYESGKKYDEFYIELGEELGRRVALAFENSKLYRISQKAIEVRNDFLSIASHELNTPITSLKLQLQMVKKNLYAQDSVNFVDKFSTSVDSSIKQIDRLINLVQVLLDVSHIQSGKLSLTFKEINVKEMVNEVVERQREILSRNNCEITVHNEKNIFATWDKTRIEQVLINLLSNAIKYAPGKIILSIDEDKDNVLINVKDFGRGIPQDKLTAIFDRFERIITNEYIGGLGLGLFIVKEIIEAHKGTIEIESQIDIGSSFKIKLPKNL